MIVLCIFVLCSLLEFPLITALGFDLHLENETSWNFPLTFRTFSKFFWNKEWNVLWHPVGPNNFLSENQGICLNMVATRAPEVKFFRARNKFC